jgi:alpha-tubulin suppressor-like RCC1 family protein
MGVSQHKRPHWQLSLPLDGIANSDSIKHVFGTHDGPGGGITTDNHIFFLQYGPQGMKLQTSDDGHGARIAHIAIAQNNRVSIVLATADDLPCIEIVEFSAWLDFIAWLTDPTGNVKEPLKKPIIHQKIPGRAISMVAGANAFVILTESGDVFTWGDSRHPKSLARVPNVNSPANEPSLIEHLAGIAISKIQAGGWLFGALSRESDLYLWGSGRPGTGERIPYLPEEEDGDVKLVEHKGAENVTDFAIGSSHVVLIGSEGIYGIGENHNGQLGLGQEVGSVSEWTKLEIPQTTLYTNVSCGPYSTLIAASRSSNGGE